MKKLLIIMFLPLIACKGSYKHKIRYIDNGSVEYRYFNFKYNVGDTVEVTRTVEVWKDVTRQAIVTETKK